MKTKQKGGLKPPSSVKTTIVGGFLNPAHDPSTKRAKERQMEREREGRPVGDDDGNDDGDGGTTSVCAAKP